MVSKVIAWWYLNGFFLFLQVDRFSHTKKPLYDGVRSRQLLTTMCSLCAGADAEYIYMNKVIVSGKDKDNKGVNFKRFLSQVLTIVMIFFFFFSWKVGRRYNDMKRIAMNFYVGARSCDVGDVDPLTLSLVSTWGLSQQLLTGMRWDVVNLQIFLVYTQ